MNEICATGSKTLRHWPADPNIDEKSTRAEVLIASYGMVWDNFPPHLESIQSIFHFPLEMN